MNENLSSLRNGQTVPLTKIAYPKNSMTRDPRHSPSVIRNRVDERQFEPEDSAVYFLELLCLQVRNSLAATDWSTLPEQSRFYVRQSSDQDMSPNTPILWWAAGLDAISA